MAARRAREVAFHGLPGPTHTFGGLSPGNLASTASAGRPSSPRAAARQALAKMRAALEQGGAGAVLPPLARPHLGFLRARGFAGRDEEILAEAARKDPSALRVACSSSFMWVANAATVFGSADTADGRVVIVPANLASLPHRALETADRARQLALLFDDVERFDVRPALPAGQPDEGAANHLALSRGDRSFHLLAWGREGPTDPLAPTRFPARQSLAASQALADALRPGTAHLCRQAAAGIDGGAFHSDVLAVGHGDALLVHRAAFDDLDGCLARAGAALGALRVVVAEPGELSLADAVAAYPFNSELFSDEGGRLHLLAPRAAEELASARRFLERAAAEIDAASLRFVDLAESMGNGGGPACLRLRVPLTDEERRAVRGRVFLDHALLDELETWVERHYRDRLGLDELHDPALLDEGRRALDELGGILARPDLVEAAG